MKYLTFAETDPVVIPTLETEATVEEEGIHNEESTEKDVNLDEVKESDASESKVVQEPLLQKDMQS